MLVFERATLRILAVSDEAVRAYGYSREEFLAMTLRELIPPGQLAAFDEFYRAQRSVAAPGLIPKNRRRHRRKDGTEIVVETTSDDLVVDGIACRILVCEDVTERDRATAALARAREQLRVSEERYRLLFELNPQPMVAYDRETLEIVAVSNALVADYGYSREELRTMTILDLLMPEDVPILRAYLAGRPSGSRPVQAGAPAGYPGRRRRKDGTVIEVEVTSENLDLDGRECRLALYTDVTERNRSLAELVATREQLRVSQERYRLLFEQNPQPIVVYDRETLEIVDVSNAMVEHYGYTRDALCSMTVLDLHQPQDVGQLLSFLAASPDGARPDLADKPDGYPGRHRLRDGTIIDVEVTSTNIDLDGRACRMAHLHDVTARDRAAREVAIARDQAVEASNMKSAFLANVSHEIRTPMNGVLGMTELLLGTSLNREQREYAEQVARSGEQMLSILNDILDLSKIEGGHLELDIGDFDLRDAIDETCAVAASQAAAKGLELAVEFGPDVPRRLRGDRRRIRQIVLNLVSNAVKFTRAGTVSVRVTATPRAQNASLVRVEVSDTGIGIDPANLHRMFDPFTQADVSTTRHFGGTGLGLAIAREIVELMGGAIGASSELGRGSMFWFELELAAADTTDAGSAPAEAGAAASSWSRPPLVLIAEDSQVNQIVAARMLERCGCRVDLVKDGREAVDACRTTAYDLVLMDCQMPAMDGYAATAELRRVDGDARHTTVIAMTAHALEGDRERCLAAGMDDYISKPMRHADLVEKLRQWIPAAEAGAAAPAQPRPPRPDARAAQRAQ